LIRRPTEERVGPRRLNPGSVAELRCVLGYPEYSAAVKAAIDRGYITMHASGGYLSFTQAGADLFA
jgi:hypothetical protein